MNTSVLFLPVVLLLLVSFDLTAANPFVISDSLRQVSELEKILANPKVQSLEEQLIYTSADADDIVGRKALEIVRQIGNSVRFGGDLELAKETSIEGILEALRLVIATEHATKIALNKALELVLIGQTEAALEVLQKGLDSDRELIFIAGVPVHNAHGTALALVGGAGIEGFKHAIVSVQRSGTAIFEAMELAREITNLGVKAGGAAAASAIKAARQTITAGVKTVNKNLIDSARNVIEQLQKISFIPAKENIAMSIVESFQNGITTNNPQALFAIDRLNRNLASALSKTSNPQAIEACKVIYHGLVATIKETADAVAVAKRTLTEAGKLVSFDTDAAMAAIRKGIRAAEAEVLHGSGSGYLSLGAAIQLTNKNVAEKLVPAVMEIEYGRVSAFEELALALRAALLGILSGEDAAAEGIEAAQETCDAAGMILYQDYADAGEMAFDVMAVLQEPIPIFGKSEPL